LRFIGVARSPMNPEKIALQLYSLRNRTKTAADFIEALKTLSAIGFKAVQGGSGFFKSAELLRICSDHGISLVSAPTAGNPLTEPQKCIDHIASLSSECPRHISFSHCDGADYVDDIAVDRWMARLEEVNLLYKAAGITLSYHNHHMEFRTLNGRTVMDRIFSDTTVCAELDTHWIAEGGVCPADLTKKWAKAGRLPTIHLKDRRMGCNPAPDADSWSWFAKEFAELGTGTIDFAPVIAAAEAGGCRAYVIEQDEFYGRDEFDAVAESFRYLHENFVAR